MPFVRFSERFRTRLIDCFLPGIPLILWLFKSSRELYNGYGTSLVFYTV